MPDYSLTIQIPTYRNINQLSDCLTSLFLHTEFPYKVVIINNDPLDSSRKYLEEAIRRDQVGDRIDVINAETNLGWMAAHNLALKQCDTPYVCLMNDDVVFTPGYANFWHKLISPFNDPDVGAVGPSSNFVMGSQNLWNLTLPPFFESTLLIGFCVTMRTDLIKKIGGLDETLPGGDDLDWSIRIRDEGKKLIVHRSAYLHHIGQQTGKRVRPEWDSFHHQDMTNNALIRKHGVRKWRETIGSKVIKYVQSEPVYAQESLWVDDQIASFNGAAGLNVGCGNDPKKGMVNVDVRKKGKHGAGGQKFSLAEPELCGDANDLPVAENSQDYILAMHLFEHLVDPIESLREWRRVLKPGGSVIMTTPDYNAIGQDIMVMDYTHVHAFTPESLTSLLKVCGFTVEKTELFSSGHFGMRAHVS